MNLADQIRLHLTSWRSAGLLYLDFEMPMQFRRCSTCKVGRVCEHTPSTAVPCPVPGCGGEMVCEPIKCEDLQAERKRCSDALQRLAAKCESNATADGMVRATAAANFMRNLAEWMLTGA